MTDTCQGDHCRTIRWMQLVLLAAGLYHLFFALWTNLWPFHGFDLLAIPRPNHPMLWRTLGLISGGLGLALLIASRNPVKYWLIVLLGFLKAVTASIIIGFAVGKGELPALALLLGFFDDAVWIVPFGIILWITVRAHVGIPVARSEPLSVQEAAHVYHLSTGQSLAQASEKQPLVLVFLRHFGCTFTRQILRGLQDLESQAKEQNAQLVLIHMLQSGQEVAYLGNHSEVPRIADPRCELYRAFGLGKGGFIELFGPHVWWRTAISVVKGCGVGHLAGDGLQMPGAFVFHKTSVHSAQPARSVADMPDLKSLFGSSKAVP